MRSRVLRAGAAAALCALAGCRTAPMTFPALAPWEVRRPQLQARERLRSESWSNKARVFERLLLGQAA